MAIPLSNASTGPSLGQIHSGEEPTRTQVITQPNTSDSDSGEETMGFADDSDRFPESRFVNRLVRVLSQDLGEEGLDHKLIVCAVHSVLLESGFVGLFGDELRFPSSMAFTVSLHYTFPGVLSAGQRNSVVVKFQTLSNFVNACGSAISPGPGAAHRVCVNARNCAPAIVSLRANNSAGGYGSSGRSLFELWRAAKDGLASPLMAELCEGAGLAGPASFSGLPPEIQTRILELLPGADVARAGCVCRGLNRLSRDDDELWRKKLRDEFWPGPTGRAIGAGLCRKYFADLAVFRSGRSPPPSSADGLAPEGVAAAAKLAWLERRVDAAERCLRRHCRWTDRHSRVMEERFRLFAVHAGMDLSQLPPFPRPRPSSYYDSSTEEEEEEEEEFSDEDMSEEEEEEEEEEGEEEEEEEEEEG